MLKHQRTFVAMRTTLDIDDDVLTAAKEHAAIERKSLGAVMSSLARTALRSSPPMTRRSASADAACRLPAWSTGHVGRPRDGTSAPPSSNP